MISCPICRGAPAWRRWQESPICPCLRLSVSEDGTWTFARTSSQHPELLVTELRLRTRPGRGSAGPRLSRWVGDGYVPLAGDSEASVRRSVAEEEVRAVLES